MKVLIVSQYFSPDITAGAFRVSETCKYIRDAGHRVFVVTTFPHRSNVGSANELNASNEPDTFRVKLNISDSRSILNYGRHYLSFVLKSIPILLRLFRTQKIDVILITSPPITTVILGVALSKLFKIPLVFEVRDLWPDSALSTGDLKQGSMVYKALKFIEYVGYKNARYIVAVAQPMADFIRNKTDTPVEVIYNGFHEDFSVNCSTKTEGNIFLYAGNVGLTQDLELVLRAFESVVREEDIHDWEFHVVGNGKEFARLKSEFSTESSSGRVKFFKEISKSEIFETLSKAKCLVIPLKGDPILNLSIPSKMFDYCSAGRPILYSILGEGKEILSQNKGNVFAAPGNELAMKEAIFYIISNYSRLQILAKENRRLIETRFTRRVNAEKMMVLLRQILAANETSL